MRIGSLSLSNGMLIIQTNLILSKWKQWPKGSCCETPISLYPHEKYPYFTMEMFGLFTVK